MASDRDPRSDLVAWLGEELRRARLATGFKSQDQLARKLGFERTVITKTETGERPPSAEVAEALQMLFPGLAGGRFAELAGVARRAFGKFPGWFERDWLPVERDAASLRWWEPMLIPGLLQTPEYARALFEAWQPAASPEDLDALVAGRLDRQRILDRDVPPDLRVVLDQAVLHKAIGSAKIMGGQLEHLADLSCRPLITVQVVPAELGAHGGLLGALIIASPAGIVYLETAVEAQITGDALIRDRAALIFDRLTRDALPGTPCPRRVPRPDLEGGTRAMEHINQPAWRTSSHSGGNGGACVEVAAHDGMILVRDTKNHGRGPVQRYTPAAWCAFVAGVRHGAVVIGESGRLP